MNRSICIHGHFYQPARENPWLLEVERQPSAKPYHDWNERVVAEAYATNAAARILDSEKRIVDIVDNFAAISFDVGPTILTWLERRNPEVYQAILAADRKSQERFSGHGGAIAQAYSHMIMPLANARDKYTQVQWGIADFEHRFGRKPEGMWLPETAVDLETLEILVDAGIGFTILEPRQAGRVRQIGVDSEWTDVSDGSIDTTMPYLCRLPSGRTIALFFFNAPISTDIAYGPLLENGDRFRDRLIAAFLPDDDRPQLVHIANDGETYGHHRRFGEMALAYCMRTIEERDLAGITVYAEHLERHPPTHEVQIREYTSWSCGHGVDRWRCDCSCCIDAKPGSSQAWRGPLREAMDWLREYCVQIYEQDMNRLVRDPWAARNDFIRVILDRSADSVGLFFADHALRDLSHQEKVRALALLEMQRQAMLMYTSCGWFFDEISGIEPVQVMRHAARAMQLLRDLGHADLENGFTRILENARSNLKEFGNGAIVYDRMVRPSVIPLQRVGLHRVLDTFFGGAEAHAGPNDPYTLLCDSCDRVDSEHLRLVLGRYRIRSSLTWENPAFACAVLYYDQNQLAAGYRVPTDEASFSMLRKSILEAFASGDTEALLVLLEQMFGANLFSVSGLTEDEQAHFLLWVLDTMRSELERSLEGIYVQFSPLMQVMEERGVGIPKTLAAIREFIVNRDIARMLAKEEVDIQALRSLVGIVKMDGLEPDIPRISAAASECIHALMQEFARRPGDVAKLETIEAIFGNLTPLRLSLDLTKSQNCYHALVRQCYVRQKERAGTGDESAKDWLTKFARIGSYLRVRLP